MRTMEQAVQEFESLLVQTEDDFAAGQFYNITGMIPVLKALQQMRREFPEMNQPKESVVDEYVLKAMELHNRCVRLGLEVTAPVRRRARARLVSDVVRMKGVPADQVTVEDMDEVLAKKFEAISYLPVAFGSMTMEERDKLWQEASP